MKLPNVFANRIEKDINNNVTYYHEERNGKVKDLSELRSMFDSKGYVNRLKVVLEFMDGTKKEEKLVLDKGSYFININNEKINYSDIKDYEIKK